MTLSTAELFLFVIFPISSLVSFIWVNGIENMNENYKDYKGEDFLN